MTSSTPQQDQQKVSLPAWQLVSVVPSVVLSVLGIALAFLAIRNAQIEGIRQSNDLYIDSIRQEDAAQFRAIQAEMNESTRATATRLDAIRSLLLQRQTSPDITSG